MDLRTEITVTDPRSRKWTIERLRTARESEDRVEFKRGEGGNVAYDGGNRTRPGERRRCILGYVVALCNEGGGSIVIGMHDKWPHEVVGTRQCENGIGQLESDVYKDVGIRPYVYELFENEREKTGRVLVVEVPGRPAGKVFKFEDVPLMRTGEDLRPMSDEFLCKILQEQEPDFSQQICEAATFDDLDENAICVMREKYAKKQKNDKFLSLGTRQVLTDLELIVDGRITNGAVILVGKEGALKRLLPQAAVMLEYRSSESQIPFDNRMVYRKPFYLMIEELWHDINLRNGNFQIKEGPYIFNVPYFNEEVIREAVNNAIAHRDYRRTSETVVRLYPQKMTIVNAGGFPHGVTPDNILSVPSTPRNRLLADVLSKTGIVERSGQGVDKIYYDTLSEGKADPDYSRSDDFKVELSLYGSMKDRGFALFIESEQQTLSDDQKLSVFEIVALAKLRDGVQSSELDRDVLRSLLSRGLIEKRGRTRGQHYVLCRSYYEFTGNTAEYTRKLEWNVDQMLAIIEPHLLRFNEAKMGDFVGLLADHMTRRQIRSYVDRLVEQRVLKSAGVGAGTKYSLADEFKNSSRMLGEVLRLGLEELNRRKCPNSSCEDAACEGGEAALS